MCSQPREGVAYFPERPLPLGLLVLPVLLLVLLRILDPVLEVGLEALLALVPVVLAVGALVQSTPASEAFVLPKIGHGHSCSRQYPRASLTLAGADPVA